MNKRQFLTRATGMLLGGASVSTLTSHAATPQPEAQVILTIAGAVTHANRGKLDPVVDQLMHKQGVQFERAWQCTLADLNRLPPTSIKPTMEYDGKQHQLSGPQLLDVLNLAGISSSPATKILFHGIDGYSPEITLGLARQYNFIVATHLDGRLLNIGGFGPLFAIYDADHVPDMAKKPLAERFVACPWGLYCIEVS